MKGFRKVENLKLRLIPIAAKIEQGLVFEKRGKTAATSESGRLKVTLKVFQSSPINPWT